MPIIEEVMTLKEASEFYCVPQTTIKSSCTGQKLLPPRFSNDECRKSAGTWLVTRSGMERLYGNNYRYLMKIGKLPNYYDEEDEDED